MSFKQASINCYLLGVELFLGWAMGERLVDALLEADLLRLFELVCLREAGIHERYLWIYIPWTYFSEIQINNVNENIQV